MITAVVWILSDPSFEPITQFMAALISIVGGVVIHPAGEEIEASKIAFSVRRRALSITIMLVLCVVLGVGFVILQNTTSGGAEPSDETRSTSPINTPPPTHQQTV